MVLHPLFSHYESTQDVEYTHRSFEFAYRALGFPPPMRSNDAGPAEAARKFGLGADWMNDYADMALPWELECVITPTL